MKRLRRVISKQSTSPNTAATGTPTGLAGSSTFSTATETPATSSLTNEQTTRDPSFLAFLGRSTTRRRGSDTNTSLHRSTQSFSIPNAPSIRDWRVFREGSSSRHKRTHSALLPQPQMQNQTQQQQQQQQQSAATMAMNQPVGVSMMRMTRSQDFIGYPPGGAQIDDSGLVLLCEQRSPDICEYTVRRDSAGIRPSDILAIALVSWAAHIFFRGPLILVFMPMVVYLVRSSLQVYQESLIVIRNVGIQTEHITLAGFRSVRSFELPQIKDLFIHEALQMFEYRYYMAILPRDPKDKIIIMFPHLLPRLNSLLPVYHGARQLLFK